MLTGLTRLLAQIKLSLRHFELVRPASVLLYKLEKRKLNITSHCAKTLRSTVN